MTFGGDHWKPERRIRRLAALSVLDHGDNRMTFNFLQSAKIIALVLLLAAASTASSQVESIDVSAAEIVSISHPQLFEESEGGVSANDLLNGQQALSLFRRSGSSIASTGFAPVGAWLHVRLHNAGRAPIHRILAIDNPLVDSVVFHPRDDRSAGNPALDGAATQPPATHAADSLPLSLAPGQTMDVLVRASGTNPLILPLTVYTPEAFAAHHRGIHLWAGLFCGALLIIGAYNIALCFAMKRRTYLWFGLHLIAMTLLIIVLSGLRTSDFLQRLGLGGNLLLATLSLAMAMTLVYAIDMLQLARRWPVAADAFKGLAGLRFAMTATSLFFAPQWLVMFGFALLVVEAVAIISIASRQALHGVGPANLLLVGWSLLLLALPGFAAMSFGWLQPLIDPASAIPFAVLSGAVIISFSSALRYESLHDQVETATMQTSTSIEKGIAERTRELARTMASLNDANLRLREANDRDGLTGVYNRRYFDNNVDGLMSRSRIASQPFSALIADIDHFKMINDSAGHLVGDDCIRHVAHILQDVVGSSGSVLRYGGEEFVALLPGQTAQMAIKIGERIRQKIAATPLTSRGATVKMTISIGIETSSGKDRMSAATIIRSADQALYAAKGDGRNRVVHATSVKNSSASDA